MKGIAEVTQEIVENGLKKVVPSVLDTADYTFPLQVSTGQHPPRTCLWSLAPGPHPPTHPPSGTKNFTPEKHWPHLKSSVKIPTEKT